MTTNGGLFEFFRFHGVWAPGVRLFRRLGFAAKATLISLAFLVPIGLLVYSFWSAKSEALDFVRQERAGIRYLQLLLPLQQATVAERDAGRLGGSGAPDRATLRSAVERAQAGLGAALQTQEAYDAVAKAEEKLAGAGSRDAAARRAAFDDLLHKQADLAQRTLDTSNLSLDPDLDTYYTMSAAYVDAPGLAAAATQLRDGLAAVAAGERPDRARLLELGGAVDALQRTAGSLGDDTAKAQTQTPGVAAAALVDESAKAAQALLAAARRALATESGTASDADIAAADAAIAAGFASATHGGEMLDRMLVRRETALAASRDSIVVATIACLALAAYLFYSFSLVMHGGLEEVQAHLERIAEGDLTTTPNPWGNDEAARLMRTLAQMQRSLRGIVHAVRQTSDSIVQATREIASGASDLSQRTEESASSLEQSSASMGRIAEGARQSAQDSRRGAEIAERNAASATEGGRVIGAVVEKMRSIGASSSRVAEITGVIDGIAFQTNILALNASIEAARAGEHGRGFSVVAGEVRSLALRSAKAAQEIKSLITGSVEEVRSGMGVAQGAGDAIGSIVDNADQLRQLLANISGSASAQNDGIDWISKAVGEIDRSTQQNSALVEQMAAAAASLKEQADGLAREVSRFVLPASLQPTDQRCPPGVDVRSG